MVLAVIALGVLIWIGVTIYQPFMDFITSDHSAGEVSMPEPETSSQMPIGASSELEPEPAPEPAANALRSVYLPMETARDAAALTVFLDSLKGTDVNAVMVDIKDAAGKVLYATTNGQAVATGAVVENSLDLTAFAQTLEANGLSLVVRMSAFRDPIAASANNRDNAILYGDSTERWMWLDVDSVAWLNPYAEGARAYLIALAAEAVDAGAKLVVMNDMHFPYGSANNANLGPNVGETTRAQILTTFMEDLSARLHEKNARAAVYMSASSIVAEAENATRYGGSPLDVKMQTLILGALPYQFRDDFSSGGLEVVQPLQNPAGVTQSSIAFIRDAYTQRGEDSPEIILLLQGGNETNNAETPYTAEQIAAQLDAVKTAELGEYILYQTGGNYLLKAGAENASEQPANPESPASPE